MEINKDNLEKALGGDKKGEQQKNSQMPKEMEIGFHQGALTTLSSERTELIKMIQNVEKIMGMHISRLEQLGIKVQTKKE